MLNGTNSSGIFSPLHSPGGDKQWTFSERQVRRVDVTALTRPIFHSKYVWLRKVLKVPIKLDVSNWVFFCRSIPKALWVGSLLAVAWG